MTTQEKLGTQISGADPGFLKGGGVQIRSTSKKRGGRRGSYFGPNVKKPIHRGTKGGPDPLDPPGSATGFVHFHQTVCGLYII